ncbi:TPA: hypothetical protein KPG57_001608 [Clostridioides difficile]|nr:hypothetical protein [Clostridioides difficile]
MILGLYTKKEFEENRRGYRDEISTLNGQIFFRTKEKENLNKELENVKREYKEAKGYIKRLETSNKVLNKNCIDTYEKNNKLESLVEELENKNAQLYTERLVLKKDIEEFQEKIKLIESKFNKTINDKINRLEAIKRRTKKNRIKKKLEYIIGMLELKGFSD